MKKQEENLEELLKAELEKEAEAISNEVESDEALQDIPFPEDLDEKVMNRIQSYEEQQEAYEKLSDADKEAIRLGRELQALRGNSENAETDTGKKTGKMVKRRKRHWKVYGLVAIVAVLVMMFGMVSIGGTPFFGRVISDTIGKREMVKVNTEREDGDKNEVDDHDESKVYEEIKEKMGVDVVRLRRRSTGMKLIQSDIDDVLKRVCLIYENDETLIQYQMEIQCENKSYAYDIEDKKIKDTKMEVDGNEIDIIQYELEDGTEENVAQFSYKDTFYTLSAVMKEDDFKNLLKNLYFF